MSFAVSLLASARETYFAMARLITVSSHQAGYVFFLITCPRQTIYLCSVVSSCDVSRTILVKLPELRTAPRNRNRSLLSFIGPHKMRFIIGRSSWNSFGVVVVSGALYLTVLCLDRMVNLTNYIYIGNCPIYLHADTATEVCMYLVAIEATIFCFSDCTTWSRSQLYRPQVTSWIWLLR